MLETTVRLPNDGCLTRHIYGGVITLSAIRGYFQTKPSVNELELIEAVASVAGESKSSTSEAIDAILQLVTAAVARGATVQLIGFGSFSTGNRSERDGRDPSTGETITIPAAKTVKFIAG